MLVSAEGGNMLKNIDPLLTPTLLGALAEMGHGDLVAVVDRNFPAHSHGRVVVELPQSGVVEVIGAILSVLPVDAYIDPAIVHMLTDDGEESPATAAVREVWNAAEGRVVPDGGIRRHDGFYDRCRGAYVTVRTGETLPYACYLISKGTI